MCPFFPVKEFLSQIIYEIIHIRPAGTFSIHSKMEMSSIQEYFQPKICRKIKIFSLSQRNNIPIKNKECSAKRFLFQARLKVARGVLLPFKTNLKAFENFA